MLTGISLTQWFPKSANNFVIELLNLDREKLDKENARDDEDITLLKENLGLSTSNQDDKIQTSYVKVLMKIAERQYKIEMTTEIS